MRRFTQKELEAAYTQMREEREAEYVNAKRAADHLLEQLSVRDKSCNIGTTYGAPKEPQPYPTQYVLSLVTQTYGPDLEYYVKELEKMPSVKKTEGVPGFYIHHPFYEVPTPFGKYTMTFEYFDNHASGW